MNTLYISLLCIVLYSVALFLKVQLTMADRNASKSTPISAILLLALAVHAIILYKHIMSNPEFVNLSIFNTSSLTAWFILCITWVSIIRNITIDKALFIVLPFCILSIACNELLVNSSHLRPREMFSPGLLLHIVLSIFAYSTLSITCIQAIILFIQEANMKNKKHTRIMSWLPPIETAEILLFNLLTFGLSLLSIAIATGALFIEDIFAQKMAHKLVLTLISWLIFTALLAGRYFRGWRGITAIKWTFAGFIALMLAYFGSKFALEIVLQKPSIL